MNIVCMGDALIDFKATGPLAFQGYVGGSPLNVAVTAARLGAEVGFASQVSSDQFGQAIRRRLRDNGVDTSLLLESDHPSTLAFVGEMDGEAVFDFLATETADVLYNPEPRQTFPESVRLVQFGSISLLQEPAATTLTDTVRNHHERAIIVFDPNVRPALIRDRDAYQARLEQDWLPLSHLVKVSSQDLRWLYPGQPYEAVAQAWLGRGPGIVLVTDGENGVTYYGGDTSFQVSAPRVTVVDTVGAGDTFTGALMVRMLERGLEPADPGEAAWKDAVAFAAAAAAVNCTRPGANPPTRAELDAFLADAR